MARKVYRDITEEIGVDVDLWISDLDSFIDQFTKIRDEYTEAGYYDLKIELDYDYMGSIRGWTLKGTRKETDQERDKRLLDARKEREKSIKKRQEQEEIEKEQLRSLIKKHGIPE